MTKTTGRIAILVHGLGAAPVVMWPLARFLRRHGYTPIRWGYSPLVRTVAPHGRRLAEVLPRLVADACRVDIVTHSLGAIIVRLALQDHLPTGTGRMVAMAAPHHGVPLATRGRTLFGARLPLAAELATDDESLVNQLPNEVGCELGNLAARYDFVVPRASTHLQGEADHHCIAATHSSLLVQPDAHRQVLHFLEHGRFDQPTGIDQ